MGSKGGEWARAFTDHYATVTNYNDAAVMRLLVERPTVFATEIPRSIEDGRGSGGTAREGERGEEDQRRPVERVVNPFSPRARNRFYLRVPAQFRIRSRPPNLAYLAYP